jgi:hypothetical protein
VKLKSHGRSERRLTAGTEKEYRIFIFWINIELYNSEK